MSLLLKSPNSGQLANIFDHQTVYDSDFARVYDYYQDMADTQKDERI